jgi:hypothetical protein
MEGTGEPLRCDMKSYETSGTVQGDGELSIRGLPFSAGTEVEVTVSPKRQPPEQFAALWADVSQKMRAVSGDISDAEIQKEIDAYRADR